MDRRRTAIIGLVLFCLFTPWVAGQDRVPKPEFESGYEIPQLTVPEQRSNILEFLDVIVLAGALALSVFLSLRYRRRTPIFWLTVFSLAYFGFFRKGCICPVGATQNIVLALFQPSYIIPITAVLFFVLPLITALFFGRTFCSSVCPLGAVQEVVIYKPLKIPRWISRPLSFLPVLYLGFTVLFAATGSEFLICRFDPFVSLFRFGGSFEILILGAVFILTGLFIARPYCRFFCPYGLILSWMSRLSWRHTTITPDQCIQCSLCKDSCPVEAILPPSPTAADSKREKDRRALGILLAVTPIVVAIGVLAGWGLHRGLARMHPTVRTAEQILMEDSGSVEGMTLLSETFRASTTTTPSLLANAEQIVGWFKKGGMVLGGFIGLMIVLWMVGLYRREISQDYRPHRGDCVSCGRCFSYCPREHEARKKIKVGA